MSEGRYSNVDYYSTKKDCKIVKFKDVDFEGLIKNQAERNKLNKALEKLKELEECIKILSNDFWELKKSLDPISPEEVPSESTKELEETVETVQEYDNTYSVGDTVTYKGFTVKIVKVNSDKVYFKNPIGKNMIAIRADKLKSAQK